MAVLDESHDWRNPVEGDQAQERSESYYFNRFDPTWVPETSRRATSRRTKGLHAH